MLLMCKNTPVYDIDNEKTLNTSLLPGLMQQKGANNHTFTKWMKYRYSSGTNTMARKLKGITFGPGARMRISREDLIQMILTSRRSLIYLEKQVRRCLS